MNELHDHHVRTYNEHKLVTAMDRIANELDEDQIDDLEHLLNMHLCVFLNSSGLD
jgi:hypothetical protein